MAPNTSVLFAALADPTRRSIFECLVGEGEQNVRALTDFARISQPAVSKHLRVLKDAGLVADRRAGRETHYRVDQQGLAPLIDWFAHYGGFWAERFDRLDALLNRMDN